MKSNIAIPLNISIKPFKDYFLKQLNGFLNDKTRTSLATLLAIDYSGRLDSAPDLTTYVDDCVAKIKKHSSQIKPDDESFSTIMILFSTAITPETSVETDSSESLKKSQDALISAVITANFSDLTPQELSHIKSLMQDILQASEGKEMMEIITSNPKLFYSIVVSTYRKNKRQKDLLRLVHIQLINIAFQKKTILIDKKPILNELIHKKIDSIPKSEKKGFTEKTQKTSTLSKTIEQKELHKKEKELVTNFIKSKPKKTLLDKIKEEKSTKKPSEKSRSF